MNVVTTLHKVTTLVILAITLFLAFIFIGDMSNMHRWDSSSQRGLKNLHRSWVMDGRPTNYNVSDYIEYSDTGILYSVDTNRYFVDGQTLSGLYKAEYMRPNKKLRVFIITKESILIGQRGSRFIIQTKLQ